jgi:hypothetical protein
MTRILDCSKGRYIYRIPTEFSMTPPPTTMAPTGLPAHERSSKSWIAQHEAHSDVSRWHIPEGQSRRAFIRRCARNALPDRIAHFFHPTRATLASENEGQSMTQEWTSRQHRKHWYQYRSPTTGDSRHRDTTWGKLALMTGFEYWNISWWVAQVRNVCF